MFIILNISLLFGYEVRGVGRNVVRFRFGGTLSSHVTGPWSVDKFWGKVLNDRPTEVRSMSWRDGVKGVNVFLLFLLKLKQPDSTPEFCALHRPLTPFCRYTSQ